MGRNEVQDKALEIISQHDRCGLGISMGVGKTRIALQHMMNHFLLLVTRHISIPR